MIDFDFETEYAKTVRGNRFVEASVHPSPNIGAYFAVKRVLDVFLSLMGIAISLLPALLIAFVIKSSSAGPVFYTQDRLGHHGKPFKIIKFRTMAPDAEKTTGAVWSNDEDPRVTKFGRILRRTHLDELPQFVNVLKGDMSLVGPRPERECFYQEFAEYIDGFDQRLAVPQGMTGLAQIMGPYDLKPEKKIIYDLHYIKHLSLGKDFCILIRTLI